MVIGKPQKGEETGAAESAYRRRTATAIGGQGAQGSLFISERMGAKMSDQWRPTHGIAEARAGAHTHAAEGPGAERTRRQSNTATGQDAEACP
jgi:hypothetical protein